MIRNGLGKVMWVGRATVFLVGLAVILALVFGVASTAFGANGQSFLLGKKNVASAISTLVKQGAGPALKLQVGAGQPPLAVNSSARVANLNAASAGRADSAANADSATNAQNADKLDGVDSTGFLGSTAKAADADKLDGIDSTSFLRSTAKAQDADKLDGLDSSAFGITTDHNFTPSADCDNPAIANQCGKVQVVVPPGKQYLVSVWSTMSWKGGATEQTISYCSAMNEGCITPFGPPNHVTVPAGKYVSASSEGETNPLFEGTYTFNTRVITQAQVAPATSTDQGVVITKVMVRDASAPRPTGVSLIP